jgi:1-acyl-sn-glycerol-3-phosphate acyltransferase
VLARRHERAWAISRAGARALLRLAGIRLETTGLEHLPRDGRCVLVANHSSYADGIVVVAALPRPCAFVAKRELRDQAIAGRYLSSLGARYVERFAAEESVRDAQLLRGVVEEGRPLFFFPEGTFTRVAGLRGFRLGAFVVAADTRAPVVPVAIRGTRALLPEGSWLPRRASLRVSVGAPRVAPADAADAFAAALAMRDSARAFITEHCGEADLTAGNRPRRA